MIEEGTVVTGTIPLEDDGAVVDLGDLRLKQARRGVINHTENGIYRIEQMLSGDDVFPLPNKPHVKEILEIELGLLREELASMRERWGLEGDES